MSVKEPPIRDELTDKETGAVSLSWILFFNQLFYGDAGTPWTPTFIDLTNVGGAPTITGRYYRISQYLCFFTITITPVTNTSAVAGTTYCDNFPLEANGNGICGTVSNNLGGGLGMVNPSNNRIYVPAWTTVTTPITIIGIVEAQ